MRDSRFSCEILECNVSLARPLADRAIQILMMSMFGCCRRVWRSTIDAFVLETYATASIGLFRSPSKWPTILPERSANNRKINRYFSRFQDCSAISTMLAPQIPVTRVLSAIPVPSMDRSRVPVQPDIRE